MDVKGCTVTGCAWKVEWIACIKWGCERTRSDRGAWKIETRGRSSVFVLVKAALHISPIISESVFTIVVMANKTAHGESST